MTRLSAGFSAETLQARMQWHDLFNMLKGNAFNQVLYPTRLSFKTEGEIEFIRQTKAKEFIPNLHQWIDHPDIIGLTRNVKGSCLS